MFSFRPVHPHALNHPLRAAAVRLTLTLAVGAFLVVGSAGTALATTTTTPTTTLTSSPKPVVSPFIGPLTTPCPPAASFHPSPAVTGPPSSYPTTAAAGPVGGSLLGSSGVVVHPAPGVPHTPDITASSWVIADADTGEVLAAKDPHGHYRPASTLKTLTAVTLIPRMDPCQIYVAKNKDLHAECTCVPVVDGVAYRVKMLLTGMLVVSGNDAADTLAGAYGGINKTVSAMNAEAKYLKAYDTTAGTPSGLDTPTERSSAYDLALIARAGLAMPDFRGYVGTRHAQWTMPHGQTQTLITHDHLLANYDGAIGVKNGYTVAAQATFIGAATRNGHTIIATLMHSTVGPQVWREDAALLDWGFAAEGKVTPVGQLVSPDEAPLPTTAAPTSAGATSSGSAAASSTHKTAAAAAAGGSQDQPTAPSSSSSVVLPLGAAAVLVMAATTLLTTLQRRRRRLSRLRVPEPQ